MQPISVYIHYTFLHEGNNGKEVILDSCLFLPIFFWSLEKRVNKKVMAMFEKAEDEYNDLISKKNIIEVS